MDSRDPEEEGCQLRPNHFPNKPSLAVFVSESYFRFCSAYPALSICLLKKKLTCVCPLSRCRITCLRHHHSQGSWTPAATKRTCTRPRRRATQASSIMTTTWCQGPWRPSFTTWSQLWIIIQMWVFTLYLFFYFIFLFIFYFFKSALVVSCPWQFHQSKEDEAFLLFVLSKKRCCHSHFHFP